MIILSTSSNRFFTSRQLIYMSFYGPWQKLHLLKEKEWVWNSDESHSVKFSGTEVLPLTSLRLVVALIKRFYVNTGMLELVCSVRGT